MVRRSMLFAQNLQLVGISATTGRKLLLTIAVFLVVALVSATLGRFLDRLTRTHLKAGFWSRQTLRILLAAALVLGIVAIWFDDPGRLATVAGLVTAGVAIALQKVITALAGYVIILRGNQFAVGDRITIGGVRGDVVRLDFMQTTVMEMGQAPGEQEDDPSTWIEARQYTGRLVRVTNDRIFDTPLYNYTRAFPYIWEELHLPVKYGADRRRAEQILGDVVTRHTAHIAREAESAREQLMREFPLPGELTLEPRIYMKLTDNWVELAARFLVPAHGIRQIKSDISHDLLDELERAGIEVASSTFGIVEVPPIRVVGAD